MLTHKHIGKICYLFLALCVFICFAFMYSDFFGITQAENTNTYVQKLFSEPTINSIDIVVDEDDWNSMLDNATDKEYILCTLIINGEQFSNIAIRTKGNSSLQQVQSTGSDRYSFKIEFDHYDDSITYYGLDKLCLNNIVQDNTYMKDFLAYDLMNEFGVAAPLSNYASVSLNGETYGLYLAVEAIEDSFLQRNYGNDYGTLYKPESSGDARQGANSFVIVQSVAEDIPTEAQTNSKSAPTDTASGRENTGNMPSDTASGSKNNQAMSKEQQEPTIEKESTSSSSISTSALSSAFGYTGDDITDYSYIFDNAVTDFTEQDQENIIASIKQLSTQENLEEVVDVEQLIRYFIVHNFLLNFDSYTGGIMHNYYMYEENGVMTMLPWDYNLSFVSFMTSYSTKSLINYPIDTPVTSSTVENRPMLAWIFSNEEYTELYHTLFQEFIDELFVTGYFYDLVDDVEELITIDVENDPSKFCTFEQFVQGVSSLKEFVVLRIESIQGQLDGTIGSTSDDQKGDENLILPGDVDVTDTGTETVQKATGNAQSPTRTQSSSQSNNNSQMQSRNIGTTQRVGIGGVTITQVTKQQGLTDSQKQACVLVGVMAIAIVFAYTYRRRTDLK